MTVIPTRTVGNDKVGSIGYGAMGLAAFYGEPADQKTVNEILTECIKQGVTMLDTADMYSPRSYGGPGLNEEQIGRFFKDCPGSREKVFLATKFVNFVNPDGTFVQRGDKEYCHKCCEESLRRLGVDQIDLFYAHRPAPNADVTETVAAMKELKDAGKIKYIGVSEYNLDQLERSNKIAHIDAIQIEFSAWTPNILTNGILEWAEKNGTAIVAYSPLGRGFLTGQYKKPDDFSEGDYRRNNPRFESENFTKNLKLVNDMKEIASRKGVTPGQIALAYTLSKSDSIIPIPGTKKMNYLNENIQAANVKLSAEEIKEIDGVINSFTVSGGRYPEGMPNLAF